MQMLNKDKTGELIIKKYRSQLNKKGAVTWLKKI